MTRSIEGLRLCELISTLRLTDHPLYGRAIGASVIKSERIQYCHSVILEGDEAAFDDDLLSCETETEVRKRWT